MFVFQSKRKRKAEFPLPKSVLKKKAIFFFFFWGGGGGGHKRVGGFSQNSKKFNTIAIVE